MSPPFTPAAVRSVIVGTGFMGDVHARAVRAAGGTVAAVVSRSADQAAAAARQFGAQSAYTSVAEALTHGDVDVVHICTPNHTHTALAHEVLEAGVHVICEKPLATSVADAENLEAAATAAGVVHAIPFAYRFYGSVREARARILASPRGDVRIVHGSYLQDWLSRPDDTNWRVDPALGGQSRAFGDIGVHWCDLVEFVTGHRIARVSAQTARATTTRSLRIRHRGRRSHAVRHRPRGHRLERDQPDLTRPQEPALVLRGHRRRLIPVRPGEP